MQDYTHTIISYRTYNNIQNEMYLNSSELPLRTDVLTFEYITLLLHSFDQKYIICVNSMNLLKNRLCTLSNVFMLDLLPTFIKTYQLYEFTRTDEKRQIFLSTYARNEYDGIICYFF